MKNIEIDVQTTGLFGIVAQVCINLNPFEVFLRRRTVERMLTRAIGTYGFLRWEVCLNPINKNHPVRCEAHKGRWHYIVYS